MKNQAIDFISSILENGFQKKKNKMSDAVTTIALGLAVAAGVSYIASVLMKTSDKDSSVVISEEDDQTAGKGSVKHGRKS